MLADASTCFMVSLCLSLTFLSILPKPGVDIFPETFTVAKSANRDETLPMAAQPVLSSKSVNLNSFTQISPHLLWPSSVKLPGS